MIPEQHSREIPKSDVNKTVAPQMMPPGLQIQSATAVPRATLSPEAMVYLQRRGSSFGR